MTNQSGRVLTTQSFLPAATPVIEARPESQTKASMSLQESSNPLHSLVTHVTVDQACEILHRGRSFVFELLGAGKLSGVKDNNRTLITVASIQSYLAAMPPAVFKPPPPPRLDNLKRLHEQQAKRAQRRAAHRRSKARA
jgi:hypothetical protein